MYKIKEFRTLEEGLLLLQQKVGNKSLSFGEILHILSGKGRPLLLLLLSLPFCQPIQIPGLSLPFGLIIAFIGLRMAFGKQVWLPQTLQSRDVSARTLKKITNKTLAIVKKIKPWIHPRLIGLCHSSWMKVGNGLMIFLLGLCLALPLPIPLSNLMAAWAIFCISLGMLEDDGVFILIGYFISLLTLGFFLVLALTLKEFFY